MESIQNDADDRDIDTPFLRRQSINKNLKNSQSIFRNGHPYQRANICSKIFFSWVSPLTKFGNSNRIKAENLGELIEGIDSETQHRLYTEQWMKYKDVSEYAVLKALFATYKRDILTSTLLNFLQVVFIIFIPINTALVVDYINKPKGKDGGIGVGITLVCTYILCSLGSKLISEQASYRQTLIGVKAYGAIVTTIYNKVLRVSSATNKEFSQGQIINFIQVDAGKISAIAFLFPGIARLPIQLVFALIYLFYTFGVYIFVALGVCFVLVFVNFFFACINAKLQEKVLARKDKRMKTTTEIINNIKIIKLNCWIKYFLEKVFKWRNKELSLMKYTFILNSIEIFNFVILIPMLTLVTFTIFIRDGNDFTLPQAYMSIMVLYGLQDPIQWIPAFLGYFMEFLVSMKRINKFLKCDEVNLEMISYNHGDLHNTNSDILVDHANFSWGGKQTSKANNSSDENSASSENETKEESKSVSINHEQSEIDGDAEEQKQLADVPDKPNKEIKLKDAIQVKDVTLDIQKGDFVCIIGGVGSGKSSLLSAILGDMIYLNQEIIDKYQDQMLNEEALHEINELSRDNVDKIKLGSAVSYVQQIPWIQNKTIRDNILFGLPLDEDKYNNTIHICQLASDLEMLPGGDLTEIGEKGINLSGGQKARISLARAVYADRDIILMDDPISALDSNVKKKVFEQVFMDEMKDKTRVLVTHAVDFIDKVDKIIIMEAGRIKYMGTYEELQHSDEIKHIIETLDRSKTSNEELKDSVSNLPLDNSANLLRKSFLSESGTNITENEDEEIIDVKWSVYKRFFAEHFNWLTYVVIIPMMFGFAYFAAQNTIYTGKWVENSDNDDKFWFYFRLVLIYPIVYSSLISAAFLIVNFATVKISKSLHEIMLTRVCQAPINLYFDKTPSGRILNRFSSDINKIDESIGDKILWCLQSYISSCLNIYIAALNTPWVLLIIPALVVVLAVSLKYYVKTFRELVRLENVTHTPLMNNLSETLSGATTIRTFQKQQEFISFNHTILDTNLNIGFWKDAVSRWFSIRIELICIIIFIFTASFCLYFKNKADAALVGALFLHFLSFSSEILWGCEHLTAIEGDFVSYDRCLRMLDVPQEAQDHIDGNQSLEWPTTGNIQFKKFSLKYRPDTEVILNNLSFGIRNCEKIGVVGRTGAGKSTLCLALCRIVEPYSGQILIDDLDITTIGLSDLRQKITIIPQDPTLFDGTLRFNLDPEEVFPDTYLLELAKQASLEDLICRDEKGLDQMIEEHGQNLSSGEKQLLCICRAILKQNKIVLMDEATANIDIKTEQTIQKLIHEKFKEATVITIAHRLNTIINSDKVLVLDKGRVAEFDSPQKLLDDPSSLFYSYAQSLNKD